MVLEHHALSGDAAALALESRISGEVIRPGDEVYEGDRGVWNGAYDRRPALIARPTNVADVIQVVEVARHYGLRIAVRSGGHSMAGHGTADDALVIDMSAMNDISIDPERRVARIQPGATWAEVAQAAQVHGLALTSGDMGTVGVGGLALGGGIGWLVRKYGLTIDHLLSIDVVTADGELITAAADDHPELFWGLRGGGGNFGIATSFEFRLQPVGLVLVGAIAYDAADGQDILSAYARYAMDAPDELTTMAFVMPALPLPFLPPETHGSLVVLILACYAGDPEEGARVVQPLRELGVPVGEMVAPVPYPVLFEFTKEGGLRGFRHSVRSAFAHDLTDDMASIILERARCLPSPIGMVQVRILGGAMSRVPETETAFAHRDKAVMLMATSAYGSPEEAPVNDAWTQSVLDELQPYTSGVYVNFLVDEGDGRVRAAYNPDTYSRLVQLKNRYDPTNVFHLNQNIKPSV